MDKPRTVSVHAGYYTKEQLQKVVDEFPEDAVHGDLTTEFGGTSIVLEVAQLERKLANARTNGSKYMRVSVGRLDGTIDMGMNATYRKAPKGTEFKLVQQ